MWKSYDSAAFTGSCMLKCKTPNFLFTGNLLNSTVFCHHLPWTLCHMNVNWLWHDSSGTKPRVLLIQSPDHTLMHTEDSVSFLCHINTSTGWEFLWYKDDSLIIVSGNNLTISSVLLKDAGSYKCQVRRGNSPIFHSQPSPTRNLSIEGKFEGKFAKDLSLRLDCWVPVLCHFRASEGSYPPLNWLVTSLLYRQLGAQL